MALRITLEHGGKVIINGAVIENTGSATTLKIHNKANILRGSEVMTDSDAATPARRICHALQSAYLFEDNRREYLAVFSEYLEQYVSAAPSASEIAEAIVEQVNLGNYYGALKTARKLRSHEEERAALA